MRQNGLTMNPKQCAIGYHHIQLLGYKISEAGVELSMDKVKALLAMPYAKNVRSLRRLLGLFSYSYNATFHCVLPIYVNYCGKMLHGIFPMYVRKKWMISSGH